MVSSKTIFVYLLFALSAVLFFLFLLFPDQAIRAYVNGRLAAIDPSLSMAAQTIRPAIPPGIKMIDVDLNRDTVRLAHIDDARVNPELASLVRGKKQFRFQATIAEGTVSGQATVASDGPAGHLQVEADLFQIRLDQLDVIKNNQHYTLTGLLNGRLTHDGGRTPRSISGGLMTVAQLRIALKMPLFGISELVMDQTEAEFSISGKNLRLKALTYKGPMLEGKITGTIELRQPIEQSRLNLTGNTKPQPELFARLQETIPEGVFNIRTLGTRGLTFRIRGSLDSPDVSMR